MTRRQGDRETERQGDRETGRQGDRLHDNVSCLVSRVSIDRKDLDEHNLGMAAASGW